MSTRLAAMGSATEPCDDSISLFDDSAGYEDDRGIRLCPGLTDTERRQATALYKLFGELWGLCVVCGPPGAGKDTFLNWFLYTCKRYFPNKRILRDEKPRKLFGAYAGLFNEDRIRDDLKTLRDSTKGTNATQLSDVMDAAALKWADGERAKALLQDSIVGLTEFWKYVYNREPHNPMNKTMGGIHKMYRHFPTLIVGCIQLETDLDKKTCKPFIKWRVTCARHKDSTRYSFFAEKVKYDSRLELLVPMGRATIIPVDAGKPRTYMGDGRIVVRRPDYQPETEEELLVLDALKAGHDTYENLVLFLEEGEMSEIETLATLKSLCLKLPGKRPKFAIWYPCVYHIFNSRSAPSMTTRVKAGD